MPEFTFQEALAWTGGRPAGQTRQPDRMPGLRLAGVCCDSRRLKPGCLFLALHGQAHDGHDYLKQAVLAGAAALLIDNEKALDRLSELSGQNLDVPVIMVQDTLKALQDLAAGYRLALPGKVIGVTGSVGKTSTRQMIAACLEHVLQVHQPAGNLNNEIGLPQTLLQAEARHHAIILEMGMRGPGEIALLSRIAQPDIAVITLIGTSHIGRLGSREAILAAKAEIIEGLRTGGLLVLNADDPYLMRLAASLSVPDNRFRLAFVSAGSLGDEFWHRPGIRSAAFVVQADKIRALAGQTIFQASLAIGSQVVQHAEVILPFPGEHHVMNALFGLAVAHELGVGMNQAAAGAANCLTTGNRQRVLQAGPITIMDDSYNASPESMRAALRTLAMLAGPGRRKIAALGGMLELGDFAAEAHYEIGVLAAQNGFSGLLVIGPHGSAVADGAHSVDPDLAVSLHEGHRDLVTALLPLLKPGDHLLVKGSRGFAMEQVTEAVIKEFMAESDTDASEGRKK
jgi:UDP-N-acetylmuramoyl-tripeptide--D-alanyl-D-alanine ligase